MNGTKFRLSCSSCGATFFSPDRRARYCPKCAKKKGLGSSGNAPPVRQPEAAAADARPRRPLLPLQPKEKPAPQPKKPQRPTKTAEPTPEQREHITQYYQEHCLNQEFVWKEVVAKLSDEMWLVRAAVSAVLNDLHRRKIAVSPEVKAQIIEMYKGYVERGERPEGGRRKTIACTVGIPYGQVRDIVFEYSTGRYSESPTPQPQREQLFELEKLFFAELDKGRYGWTELAEKLAAEIGAMNSWQTARWMDMLFDDEKKFANQPDVAPEVEQKILDAYRQYLAAPQPPEQALHHIIAEQVGGITPQQVHKVLQRYRNRRRAEYPLKLQVA